MYIVNGVTVCSEWPASVKSDLPAAATAAAAAADEMMMIVAHHTTGTGGVGSRCAACFPGE